MDPVRSNRRSLCQPLPIAPALALSACACVALAGVPSSRLHAARPTPLDRSRHRATAAVLFCYATEIGGVDMRSRDPDLDASLHTLASLSASFVREGGFVSGPAQKTLAAPADARTRVARLVAQLDATHTAGISEPEGTPPEQLRRPSALLLSVPVALAYVRHPEDGTRAATRCARLCDPDPHAEPCARAATAALCALLAGDQDRDRVVCRAALAADDGEVSRRLRSMRVKRWKQLGHGQGALDRIERTLRVWYAGQGFSETEREGRARLPAAGSRRFLAALAAATYGVSQLPERLMARFVDNGSASRLAHDLYDLANEGILVPVPEEATAAAAVPPRQSTGPPPRTGLPPRARSSPETPAPPACQRAGATPPSPPVATPGPASHHTPAEHAAPPDTQVARAPTVAAPPARPHPPGPANPPTAAESPESPCLPVIPAVPEWPTEPGWPEAQARPASATTP